MNGAVFRQGGLGDGKVAGREGLREVSEIAERNRS